MALVVLHLSFKFRYFENKWTSFKAYFIKSGKAKVRKIWEDKYKQETTI